MRSPRPRSSRATSADPSWLSAFRKRPPSGSTKSIATRASSGDDQANRYITGLFQAFERIETHQTMSKPVPAAFGVRGYFFRYERHFVYWRRLPNGDVGIVTILHERMHQIDRFREDFGLSR